MKTLAVDLEVGGLVGIVIGVLIIGLIVGFFGARWFFKQKYLSLKWFAVIS